MIEKIKIFFTKAYKEVLAQVITLVIYAMLIALVQLFFDYISNTKYFVVFLLILGRVHGYVVNFIKKLLQNI